MAYIMCVKTVGRENTKQSIRTHRADNYQVKAHSGNLDHNKNQLRPALQRSGDHGMVPNVCRCGLLRSWLPIRLAGNSKCPNCLHQLLLRSNRNGTTQHAYNQGGQMLQNGASTNAIICQPTEIAAKLPTKLAAAKRLARILGDFVWGCLPPSAANAAFNHAPRLPAVWTRHWRPHRRSQTCIARASNNQDTVIRSSKDERTPIATWRESGASARSRHGL